MQIDPERSSITFVWPFLFQGSQMQQAVALLRDARVFSRDSSMNVWEPLAFPTTDWLPHVADTLVESPGSPSIAGSFRLHNDFMQSAIGLDAREGFVFQRNVNSGISVRIELDKLNIMLFGSGVGFVTQRWRVISEAPDAWLDIQHYCRFRTLARGGSLRRGGRPAFGHELTFESIDNLALGACDFGRLVPMRDVFVCGRTLPYVVLFAQDQPESCLSNEMVLYKLRRLLHSRQAHNPTPEQEAISLPQFVPYLRNQWFFSSLEGAGFAALDAPDNDFFRSSLPKHLESDYFLLLLFSLQQRFALIDLSAEVARRWTPRPGDQTRRELREVFALIRDRLFDFTCRYQFAHLAQRDNHHNVYCFFRSTFQVDQLYEEVCCEVKEMSEYLRDCDRHAQEDRFSRVTLLLTVLVGAPSLAIGFWNININGWTSTEGFSLEEAGWWVMFVSLSIATLFAIFSLLVRSR